jgi:hypothetical protein
VTNAETYAAAEQDLQRAFDLALKPADRRSAAWAVIARVTNLADELRDEVGEQFDG